VLTRILRDVFQISTIRTFSSDHMCKFVGAGVTMALLKEVSDNLANFYEGSFPDVISGT
jgi:hypothetical protein